MIRKFRIVHIHTDYKFIKNSDQFEGPYFENEIIIVEKRESYHGLIEANYIVCNIDEKEYILKLCKKADLVVLYDLDYLKASIALELPETVKIAWRFFGYELYGKRKDLVLSPQTLKYVKHNLLKTWMKKKLLFPYYLMKVGCMSYKHLFYKAINRIDYMFVLSKEEYDYLSRYWKLPAYVKFTPKRNQPKEDAVKLFEAKLHGSTTIVIGNNRGLYNNHLDIMDIIEKSQGAEHYNFSLLFNYGGNGAYTQAVKERANRKSYYTLVTDFMPPDMFNQFYRAINALVINGYRQMAGANIFMAFQNGVKIYLNPKNVFMHWMQNLGFKVFSIERLKSDIEKNNVSLLLSDIQHNFDVLKDFSEKNSKEKFQEEIREKLQHS